MEDISVKKSYEQVKERVERILRHDLKTPLLSIINFPDYLLLDDNLTKEQKMCLKHIKESGEYMLSQLINHFIFTSSKSLTTKLKIESLIFLIQ